MIIHLVFLLQSFAHAGLDKLLTVGTFYQSNSYFEDKSAKGDFYLSVKPELNYEAKKKKGFMASAYGAGQYNKYFVHSDLDYFQYEAQAKLQNVKESETVYFIKPYAKTSAEPPANEHTDRVIRMYMGSDIGFQWRWTELSRFELEGNFQSETIDYTEAVPCDASLTNCDANFKYQENTEINASIKHFYAFLPETNLVTSIKVGQKTFPLGTQYENSGMLEQGIKYDSQYVQIGSGVEGRLTRAMKIRSYAGFLVRQYAAEASFKEPIFTLEFEEERSPRDMILLGYDYTVEDTTYSNFVLKQKMHIGFGRIFGDQLLALARLSYQYRSYSRPFRREDQRLAGEFKLDYSFSKMFKAEAVLTADLLTSESLTVVNPADPSVSYEYVRAGLFLKYLF